MSATRHAILSAALVLTGTGFAQVSSVAPKGQCSASPIELLSVTRVEASHNSPTAIRKELLDTNTIAAIAASSGLAAKELATLAVAPGPADKELWFYQTGTPGKAARLFGEKLRFYVQGRLEGHTQGFLLSSMTNGNQAMQAGDPDLQALLTQRPELPAGRLRRWELGSNTNQFGELFRSAEYYYLDGEIAWTYHIGFSEEGKALGVSEWRVDAKEYDPEYRKVIQEVDQAALAEVKQKGIHAFSEGKKEKLRAKGVSYRTFEELNPGVIVDYFK
jgi:hypothetical protein